MTDHGTRHFSGCPMQGKDYEICSCTCGFHDGDLEKLAEAQRQMDADSCVELIDGLRRLDPEDEKAIFNDLEGLYEK